MGSSKEILQNIDDELLLHEPGTDEYMKLLEQREKMVNMVKNEKNKSIDPNTILTCSCALAQVVGVAVVGFLARLDKDALRFTNVIKP